MTSDSVDVHGPRVLRALAHPLHNALLGLLRADGPATSVAAATTGLAVLGALGGSCWCPAWPRPAGLAAGFWAAAGALLLGALVSLGPRPRHSGPQSPGTPAAAGVAAGHG